MNKIKLESKVFDSIQRYSLISPEELVVVGVSGGADSVCLLHLLAKYRKRLGMKLHVAHLNHLLRGAESEADVGGRGSGIEGGSEAARAAVPAGS